MSIQDQLNVSDLKNRWGIEGYKMPFNTGLLQRRPDYSFPKEKSRSFLESLQKTASKFPAPGSYTCSLKWVKGSPDLLKKGSKRKTIFDQVSEKASKVPAPTAYFRNKRNKLQGISPLPRQDRLNFLSDAEYLGKSNPGPGDYKPNVSQKQQLAHYWMEEHPSIQIYQAQSLKRRLETQEKHDSWAFKLHTQKCVPQEGTLRSYSQSKLRKEQQSKDVKFTEKEIKLHQSVPGVGKYNLESAYKRISTPAPRTYRL